MGKIDRAEWTLGESGGCGNLPSKFGEEVADGGTGREGDFHTRPADGLGIRREQPNGDRETT